jgi:negative regulator of sigma E activity
LVLEKVGNARQGNGERLMVPVQLQVHGVKGVYRIELQLTVAGEVPVATVERFEKDPS